MYIEIWVKITVLKLMLNLYGLEVVRLFKFRCRGNLCILRYWVKITVLEFMQNFYGLEVVRLSRVNFQHSYLSQYCDNWSCIRVISWTLFVLGCAKEHTICAMRKSTWSIIGRRSSFLAFLSSCNFHVQLTALILTL